MNTQITVEEGYSCLEINGVYPEDTGEYTVVAKNMAGETRTSCLLTVEGQFPAQPVSVFTIFLSMKYKIIVYKIKVFRV